MSPSSASEYSYRPGGSLKFKGGEAPAGSKKKKKSSKSRSSTSHDVRHGESSASGRGGAGAGEERDGHAKRDGSAPVEADDDGRSGVGESAADGSSRRMTASERKFEEAQRKRMADRIAKQARMSHKDKVDQFNKSLAERSEHNDMLTVSGH